ncbi:MAG: hypothetical protein HY735_26625 [Verrucomicrobia bacterium]|nr:hypothetical protein [Verrucomicrobiota bacterium]
MNSKQQIADCRMTFPPGMTRALAGLLMGLLLNSANTASAAMKLVPPNPTIYVGRTVEMKYQIDNQPPQSAYGARFEISDRAIADWDPKYGDYSRYFLRGCRGQDGRAPALS